MDEVTTLRQHEALVAIRLYSLLDNLINALIPPETEVTPGGYSEDIFDPALPEDEKSDLECSICYNVLKDCRQCEHGHKFCASCIFVWSMQPADFSDKCPVCRCTGDYNVNSEVNGKLNKRHVHCTNEGCNWRGYLGQFQQHEHKLYSERDLIQIERNGPSGSASASGSQTARNENEANGAATAATPRNTDAQTQQVPASTAVTAQAGQEAVLPSINERTQQAPTYASSRTVSGNTRTVPTRPAQAQPAERRTSVTDRPQPRRPGVPAANQQPSPPAANAAATPRPPTLPRPQQQRTVRRRSSTNVPSPAPTESAASQQPLSASSNAATSRPSSSRLAILPPLNAAPASADSTADAPQPAQTRTVPQIPVVGNRRPQQAPLGPSRPIAPTQPASLNAPLQTSSNSTAVPTNAPQDTANASVQAAPQPLRRPTSRASSTTSYGSDSTRTSSNTMETSRSNLREVRSRLLASRQQVATILGIIAYEMEGRRRMQEYAMFENEFSRRNHQLGREMDVLRNQLQTVSQVLETIPQQPAGGLANTTAPVFGGMIAGVGLQSDSDDDSDDDFLRAIQTSRALAAQSTSTASQPPAAPQAQTNRGNQPTTRNSTATGDNTTTTNSSNIRNSNAQ